MKRLAPVAAFLGGIVCILRTVSTAVSVPMYLRYTADATLLITLLLPALITLLLGIAMLRGRKDRFLGAVLGVQGGWMAFNAINNLILLPPLRYILIAVVNLLIALMFLLLALDCFSERNVPAASRRKVFGGGMLILSFVYLLLYTHNNLLSSLGLNSLADIDMSNMPNVLTGVLVSLIGSFQVFATYVCIGYAVAGPVIRQSVPYTPYYGQANQNPYGYNNQNPYGQNNYNPFGQNNQNPFGQNNQNPYGQNNQPDRDNGKDLNHGSWN